MVDVHFAFSIPFASFTTNVAPAIEFCVNLSTFTILTFDDSISNANLAVTFTVS